VLLLLLYFYLGAAISSTTYIQEFVSDKVAGWSEEIIQLAKFAQVKPHAAYIQLLLMAYLVTGSICVVQCPELYNLLRIIFGWYLFLHLQVVLPI